MFCICPKISFFNEIQYTYIFLYVVLDSEKLQMNFFIEAVMQDSIHVVKMFLHTLHISFKHDFHIGRVLRLYTKVSFSFVVTGNCISDYHYRV